METIATITDRLNRLAPGETLNLSEEELADAGLSFNDDDVEPALEPHLTAGLSAFDFVGKNDYGRRYLAVTRLNK